VRPAPGPWYMRGEFMQVYHLTDALLDEEVRTGWVEERFLNGQYSYRRSALAGKIRLLRANAATADMASAPSHVAGHETPRPEGANLPLRALNDLVILLSEMPMPWPEEARDKLLMTLGVLAGGIAATAQPDEEIRILLENLHRFATRRTSDR
jgi:hypothetical protein